MNSREKFVKGELKKIYNQLIIVYEYCPYVILHDDKRFSKIFEVLFEINEKANILRGIVKGSYLVL